MSVTTLRSEQQRLQAAVQQREAEVRRAIATAARTLDFQRMAQLHWDAQNTANDAYRLYDAAKAAEAGLDRSLRKMIAHTAALNRGADRGAAWESARRSAAMTTASLNAQIGEFQGHTMALLTGVRRLNAETRSLKLEIRDRCGDRGQRWYRELEARTAARRSQAR